MKEIQLFSKNYLFIIFIFFLTAFKIFCEEPAHISENQISKPSASLNQQKSQQFLIKMIFELSNLEHNYFSQNPCRAETKNCVKCLKNHPFFKKYQTNNNTLDLKNSSLCFCNENLENFLTCHYENSKNLKNSCPLELFLIDTKEGIFNQKNSCSNTYPTESLNYEKEKLIDLLNKFQNVNFNEINTDNILEIFSPVAQETTFLNRTEQNNFKEYIFYLILAPTIILLDLRFNTNILRSWISATGGLLTTFLFSIPTGLTIQNYFPLKSTKGENFPLPEKSINQITSTTIKNIINEAASDCFNATIPIIYGWVFNITLDNIPPLALKNHNLIKFENRIGAKYFSFDSFQRDLFDILKLILKQASEENEEITTEKATQIDQLFFNIPNIFKDLTPDSKEQLINEIKNFFKTFGSMVIIRAGTDSTFSAFLNGLAIKFPALTNFYLNKFINLIGGVLTYQLIVYFTLMAHLKYINDDIITLKTIDLASRFNLIITAIEYMFSEGWLLAIINIFYILLLPMFINSVAPRLINDSEWQPYTWEGYLEYCTTIALAGIGALIKTFVIKRLGNKMLNLAKYPIGKYLGPAPAH